jgi:hypothetical protein
MSLLGIQLAPVFGIETLRIPFLCWELTLRPTVHIDAFRLIRLSPLGYWCQMIRLTLQQPLLAPPVFCSTPRTRPQRLMLGLLHSMGCFHLQLQHIPVALW